MTLISITTHCSQEAGGVRGFHHSEPACLKKCLPNCLQDKVKGSQWKGKINQALSPTRLINVSLQVVLETGKKVKEELERILLNFNIQVDNPIAVLNQDTAKTFLFKCDPTQLYTFFMKGTQLESCKNDYNAAHVEKIGAENLLEEKKGSLPTLKKELDKWTKKYQFHQNLSTRKEDIKKKTAELGWAVVRDHEEEIEEDRKKLVTEETKLPLADGKVQEFTEKEREARGRKKELETEITGLEQVMKDEEANVKNLKILWDKQYDQHRRVKREINQLKTKANSIEVDMEQLKAEVERLRTTGNAEQEENTRRRNAQIAQLEGKIEELEAQNRTSETHRTNLEENIRELSNKIHEKRAGKAALCGQIDRTKKELDKLRRSGQDRIAALGPNMPRIVAEINRNNRFRAKPIGPIGKYINIKKGTKPEVSRAIEHEIGGLMTSFLVTCSDDQRELFNLFKKLNLERKPIIFTCPFSNSKYNIESTRVQSAEFDALLDYLEIDDPNVYNRVVDSVQLERIVQISQTTRAQEVLSNQRTVPENLKYALVMIPYTPGKSAGLYKYYPAPAYKSKYTILILILKYCIIISKKCIRYFCSILCTALTYV